MRTMSIESDFGESALAGTRRATSRIDVAFARCANRIRLAPDVSHAGLGVTCAAPIRTFIGSKGQDVDVAFSEQQFL